MMKEIWTEKGRNSAEVLFRNYLPVLRKTTITLNTLFCDDVNI
jgi:hypothetical protein